MAGAVVGWLCAPSGALAQGRSNGWRELRRLRYNLSITLPTRLSFRVERDSRGHPLLVGQLQDDKGNGLARQVLRLHFPNGKKRLLLTDQEGRFRLSAQGWPKQGVYRMKFSGARQLAPAALQRTLDLRRVDLKLTARFPPPLESGTRTFAIGVQATYRGNVQKNLPVTLLLQTGAGRSAQPVPLAGTLSKTALTPLMTLYTNARGHVRFVWKGEALQGPGQLPLAVSFPGNDSFLPQRIQHYLVISSSASGGEGLSLGTLLLALTGVLALGLLGWAWKQGWFSRDPNIIAAPALPALSQSGEIGYVEQVAAIEDFVETIDDFCVAGVILNLGTQGRVADVQVRVQPLDPSWTHEVWETRSNAKGQFLLGCPYEGKVQVTFSHPHYQTRQMELTLPHADQPRLLRVMLASFRHLIYETFVLAARRTERGKPFDPRRQTAREWIRTLRPLQVETLEPLARAFEKAYYGSIIPTSDDYEVVRDFFDSRTERQT